MTTIKLEYSFASDFRVLKVKGSSFYFICGELVGIYDEVNYYISSDKYNLTISKYLNKLDLTKSKNKTQEELETIFFDVMREYTWNHIKTKNKENK